MATVNTPWVFSHILVSRIPLCLLKNNHVQFHPLARASPSYGATKLQARKLTHSFSKWCETPLHVCKLLLMLCHWTSEQTNCPHLRTTLRNCGLNVGTQSYQNGNKLAKYSNQVIKSGGFMVGDLPLCSEGFWGRIPGLPVVHTAPWASLGLRTALFTLCALLWSVHVWQMVHFH